MLNESRTIFSWNQEEGEEEMEEEEEEEEEEEKEEVNSWNQPFSIHDQFCTLRHSSETS